MADETSAARGRRPTEAAQAASEARVLADDLRAFARRALLAVGMRPNAATIAADAMVWADLRGIEPHGIAKLPLLLARIEAGGTAADAEPRVLTETATTALVDAGTIWGQVAGAWAMELATEKARLHRLGAVVVRNASSLGALGYYPLLAVRQGQVGLAITNSMPLLAPWGGRAKLLGNQAFALGCPTGKGFPLLLDSSNSATTWGHVRGRLERGEGLPPGLALDRDGRPTTDPAAALEGLLLPVGGHKGSGLALMFEVLTGVLGGLAMAPDVGSPEELARPQQVSAFFLALDPAAFLPLDEFTARVDELIDRVHAVPPSEGADRVVVPGERGRRREQERARQGIPLPARRLAELRTLAARLGIEPLDAGPSGE